MLMISFAMLLVIGGLRFLATRHERMRKYGLRGSSALGYLLVVLLGAALDGLLALVRPRRRASLGAR